jgi:hypothetical protein
MMMMLMMIIRARRLPSSKCVHEHVLMSTFS